MADQTAGDTSQISAPGAPVTFFKRRGGKANLRKRPPTPPPVENNNTSDSDEDDYSDEDGGGGNTALPAKRRKKQHVISSSSSLKPAEGNGQVVTQVTYAGDTSKKITASEDATKRSNWHNETEEEYLIRKRGGDLAKAAAEKVDGKLDDAYQGAAGYKSFIRKKEDAPSAKGKMGPVKAPTNVRQVVTVDFAPDVCKDYKQTGFCGFGDTCKFLHAREDYKQGWQLDNEWESAKSGKKKPAKAADDEDSDPELKDIPFACVICKQEYKFPIVTKCNHYFCEKCALQRYRKNPSCAICGAGTNGIFNGAKNLQKKLDKKKARIAKKKEEEEADGEGGESDNDGEGTKTSGFGAGIEIEGD